MTSTTSLAPSAATGNAPRKAEISFAVGASSLGAVLVATTERGICAILLGDRPDTLERELRNRFPTAAPTPGGPELDSLAARVAAIVDAPALGLDMPLDVSGTPFQRRVWQALRQIPPGATASYAEVAAGIGAPDSVRAVAAACAANVLAVAIPCHRVVRSDGSLSGYRWGTERKRALLAREARA
jgi:AraC family transcriptional regulator, regulatory protein of adaptative response / methylated-DNA-[protein]-cysteine methyltransferase